MVKSVKITPDGKVVEVSEEEEDELKQSRNRDGRSLLVPEHWKRDRKFRFTLSFLDMYGDTDLFNPPLATRLLYDLRHPTVKTKDVICGTAFLSNETLQNLIDFTKDDFDYIVVNALGSDI